VRAALLDDPEWSADLEQSMIAIFEPPS